MLPAKRNGTGKRIILSAEDDDAAYRLLELGFNELGAEFHLYRVNDGQHAIDFLRHSGLYVNAPKPDLVLLNLNMPRVNGFEVLQAIQDDPAINDIPAVVFSSSRLDRDKANCLALGARAFVTKPSDLNNFLNVLRSVCSLVDAFEMNMRSTPGSDELNS
jgi:chemotaxis family two-component system response regulator Rcp1